MGGGSSNCSPRPVRCCSSLTAFSVWLVVTVLYFIGGEGVHLFAFVMVVGVIVGTYSSIYIASPLLLIFGEGKQTGQRQAQAQADLVRLFRSARIDAIQVRTGQPYAIELGRFFETREKRRLRG